MSYLMAFREKLVVVEVESKGRGLYDTECAQPSLLCCVSSEKERDRKKGKTVRFERCGAACLRNSLFPPPPPGSSPPPPADTKPCPDKSLPPPGNLRTVFRGPQTGGESATSGHPALRELKSLVKTNGGRSQGVLFFIF